jgi:2-phospho-L-lactate/phosphoenolpyruvate guanylyltransferase
MTNFRGIAAVIPIKETIKAKQRLHALLAPAQRRELAIAMFQDVLTAVAATTGLAAIVVVTVDPAAAEMARRHRAEVYARDADDGHTAAVAGAVRRLAADRLDMLTLPADIPLVQSEDIACLLGARGASIDDGSRSFVIVPARDERGSNAVLCSPADAVALRFGNDSFFPHLTQARACGINPIVLRLARIALDIDTPEDLALLLASEGRSRTQALLANWRDCGSLTMPDTAVRHRARRSSA